MAFPALSNNDAFQPHQSYNNQNSNPYGVAYQNNQQPTPSQTNVMTYESTIRKTGIGFLILLAAAGIGWFFPILALPAVLAGLVLGLIISFKRVTNPGLVLTYSGLQGLAIGGISGVFETIYPGIVSQAVLATLSVFAVMLVGFRFRIFRTSPIMNKIFMIAGFSYLLFGLINLVLMLTNVTPGMFGLYSDLGGWGIAIGILGVLLASYSLVMDFTFIENGVNNQAPTRYEWTAVFGLIATLVWLYLEILRLLALFRN